MTRPFTRHDLGAFKGQHRAFHSEPEWRELVVLEYFGWGFIDDSLTWAATSSMTAISRQNSRD